LLRDDLRLQQELRHGCDPKPSWQARRHAGWILSPVTQNKENLLVKQFQLKMVWLVDMLLTANSTL
jgi:hypothetical protein